MYSISKTSKFVKALQAVDSNPMVIVRGPIGCGKTFMVTELCKRYKVPLLKIDDGNFNDVDLSNLYNNMDVTTSNFGLNIRNKCILISGNWYKFISSKKKHIKLVEQILTMNSFPTLLVIEHSDERLPYIPKNSPISKLLKRANVIEFQKEIIHQVKMLVAEDMLSQKEKLYDIDVICQRSKNLHELRANLDSRIKNEEKNDFFHKDDRFECIQKLSSRDDLEEVYVEESLKRFPNTLLEDYVVNLYAKKTEAEADVDRLSTFADEISSLDLLQHRVSSSLYSCIANLGVFSSHTRVWNNHAKFVQVHKPRKRKRNIEAMMKNESLMNSSSKMACIDRLCFEKKIKLSKMRHNKQKQMNDITVT